MLSCAIALSQTLQMIYLHFGQSAQGESKCMEPHLTNVYPTTKTIETHFTFTTVCHGWQFEVQLFSALADPNMLQL